MKQEVSTTRTVTRKNQFIRLETKETESIPKQHCCSEMRTSKKCKDNLTFPSLRKHHRSKAMDPRNTGCPLSHWSWASCPQRHDPIFHSACACEFRTISFLIHVQELTNVLARIFSHSWPRFWNSHYTILFPCSLHTMSSYIDMKMIRPGNCSSSHCI